MKIFRTSMFWPRDEPVLEHLLAGPLRVTHQRDEPMPLLLLDGEREQLAVHAVGDEPWAEGARPEP